MILIAVTAVYIAPPALVAELLMNPTLVLSWITR